MTSVEADELLATFGNSRSWEACYGSAHRTAVGKLCLDLALDDGSSSVFRTMSDKLGKIWGIDLSAPRSITAIMYPSGTNATLPHYDTQKGFVDVPRHVSNIIFLSDSPAEAGGALTFPRASTSGIRVQPTKGSLVSFTNVEPNGQMAKWTQTRYMALRGA